MRFAVTHTFRNITPEQYENLYWDEDFNIALCREVKLHRVLKARTVEGNNLYREVVVGPDREVPKPVARFLGSDRIEYTEIATYTFGTYRGTWKTIPSVLANKVVAEGTFEFQPDANGVRRVVQGDISVKILGVGGVAEKFIVSDVEKSYEDAARFTQRWIDEKLAG